MLPLRASALALTMAAALIPEAAGALQSDRQQEVLVEADSGIATADDSGDGDVVLTGKVTIDQGSLKIQSETGTVKRKKGEMQSALLTGSPVQISQTLDDGSQLQAQARQVDYDMIDDVILLTGSVVVVQPQGDIRGERVRYDLKTGRIEGGGNGAGRIKMRLQPATPTPESPNG